jgi:Uma2 family endonuclease
LNKITDISQLDLSKQYSYADYLTWQFTDRVELLKGWVYKMTPDPRRVQQKVEGIIFNKFFNFLENNNCEVYQLPFDVRIIKNKGLKESEISTVVQPDICVICDSDKLDDYGCIGVPDLIVEIVSPSTAKKDYNEKFNLYEENKVKEYWIANPEAQTLEIYSFNKNNNFVLLDLFDKNNDNIKGNLFPELNINFKEIFNN